MICIKCDRPVTTGEFYLLAHRYQGNEAMAVMNVVHVWCPPEFTVVQP